jgi:phosphatidate cytidylyltransferase
MTDASDDLPGDESPADAPLTRRDAAGLRKTGAPTEANTQFHSHVRAARTEFEHQVAQAKAEFEEANERIKERTGRDLIVAILIGLAIGGVLIASLVFLKWVFVLFALAASMLGVFEFSRALIGAGRRVDVIPQLVLGAGLVLSGFFVDLWLHWVAVFVAVALVVVWRLVAQMFAKDGRIYGAVLGDVLTAGFIQLYVPFLTSLCVILLRQDGGEWWVLPTPAHMRRASRSASIRWHRASARRRPGKASPAPPWRL